MKHWNIGGMEGLNSQAQKAQDDVQALLTKFRRLTDRQVTCSSLQCHCRSLPVVTVPQCALSGIHSACDGQHSIVVCKDITYCLMES